MSDILHYFEKQGERTCIALPFQLSSLLTDWSALRRPMIRECPKPFTRDEWAYLIQFLDEENLKAPFMQWVGHVTTLSKTPVHRLYRPRGELAIWLPNNVSLLGPVMTILLSLTGNTLRLKIGSRQRDLTYAFLQFCLRTKPGRTLAKIIEERILTAAFTHEDPRQTQMSERAHVRIAFGSETAAQAIQSLPHRVDVSDFYFIDRRSEAWLEKKATSTETLKTLIKVFSIFGQAGCTSPSRIVLLNGKQHEATAFRDQLAELWPRVIRERPEMQVASANMCAYQGARALGWDPVFAPGHGAVLAVGHPDHLAFESAMSLPIVAARVEEAIENLPTNIQTIGHALMQPSDPIWLKRLVPTSVKRFVPLAHMHHFGPLWDGWFFWSHAFEGMEFGV